jgi:Zn-dependent peptidase ImmA (M78 family)
MNITYLPTAVRAKANQALTLICHDEQKAVDAQIVAQAHGINVFFADFDDEAPSFVHSTLAGYYDHVENVIIINRAIDAREQNHTIAAELGKALLHPQWCQSSDYRISARDGVADTRPEKDALAFAGALLAPQADLQHFLPHLSFERLLDIFPMPASALENEIHRLI